MEPTYLYPSRLRLFFVPCVGLLGIAISFWMIFYAPPEKHPPYPHIVQVFSGWTLFVCSTLWIIGGVLNFSHRACFLKLDDTGLTVCWLYLSFYIAWSNTKEFRKVPLHCIGTNVFNVSEIKYNSRLCGGLIGYNKGPEATAAYAQARYGADVVLISNYGLSAEALVDLLNEWRLRNQKR